LAERPPRRRTRRLQLTAARIGRKWVGRPHAPGPLSPRQRRLMYHRRSGLVILCSLAFLALTVLGARPAAAQYGPPGPPPPPPGGGYQSQPRPYYQPPPPPPGVQRRGFTIGASIGGGSFTTTDQNQNVDDR